MSNKSSVKTLIQISAIETTKMDDTKRDDFFIILRIVNKPIEANSKSIKGL